MLRSLVGGWVWVERSGVGKKRVVGERGGVGGDVVAGAAAA